jgi:hypothetical protein
MGKNKVDTSSLLPSDRGMRTTCHAYNPEIRNTKLSARELIDFGLCFVRIFLCSTKITFKLNSKARHVFAGEGGVGVWWNLFRRNAGELRIRECTSVHEKL